MAAAPADQTGVEAALARSPLLRGLPARAIARLAAAGATVNAARGGLIMSKGDPGDALFVVVEGEVEVRNVSAGGKEVRLTALGAGAVLGEMAVLDGGARSADVAATRRTKLARIPRAVVMQVLEEEPRALLALVAEIVRRLRDTNDALEDSHVLDLGGRLAQLLLREGSGGGAVTLTQSEMARRIDASREKTNRKLHEWQASGWIKIDRSGVKLTKPDALQALIVANRQA